MTLPTLSVWLEPHGAFVDHGMSYIFWKIWQRPFHLNSKIRIKLVPNPFNWSPNSYHNVPWTGKISAILSLLAVPKKWVKEVYESGWKLLLPSQMVYFFSFDQEISTWPRNAQSTRLQPIQMVPKCPLEKNQNHFWKLWPRTFQLLSFLALTFSTQSLRGFRIF